jgi:transcriptional regulator with XRE-family HTH domain
VDDGVDDDLKRMAARVRRWRSEQGLTLQQLGDRADVSASTIHKIENLQTVPTIAVLLKVVHGLGRKPSELLAEGGDADAMAVLRRGDRPSVLFGEDGEVEHLIGMMPRSQLDLWRVRLEPGVGVGMPGGQPWQFPGEIAIVVEEGSLEAVVGEASHALGEGDSLHFDPSLPHRWLAGGGKPAILLVAAILPDRVQAELASRLSRAVGRDAERGSPDTAD